MEATAGAWAAEWVRLCTALLSPARAAGLRGRAAPLRCRFFETLRTDRKGGYGGMGMGMGGGMMGGYGGGMGMGGMGMEPPPLLRLEPWREPKLADLAKLSQEQQSRVEQLRRPERVLHVRPPLPPPPPCCLRHAVSHGAVAAPTVALADGMRGACVPQAIVFLQQQNAGVQPMSMAVSVSAELVAACIRLSGTAAWPPCRAHRHRLRGLELRFGMHTHIIIMAMSPGGPS